MSARVGALVPAPAPPRPARAGPGTRIRPGGAPTRAVGDAALFLAVLLGGFVFVEPAPYDLYMVVLVPLWLVVGLAVPRSVGPLIVLLILFMVGAMLALTQAKDVYSQPLYYAVTGFLVISSFLYACLVGERPQRMRLIARAWVVAALASTGLGIAGYLGFTGELFTKFGRAAGGFQDPNVFGPFLVFPLMVCVRGALTSRFGAAFLSGVASLILLTGVLLSFSRASWGLALVGVLATVAMTFLNERRPQRRARIAGIAVAGMVVAAVTLAGVLSAPQVADLFSQRAQVVQDYDVGHYGRFQRHALGFKMMSSFPLGIGAEQFWKIFGEDEHDIWLKTLTSYGWLGFAAFLTLVVWTLAAGFPVLFRPGPEQGIVQIAYFAFLGHIVMATVIDIDHWRHFFLLFGLLWGAIAADRAARQQRLRVAAAALRQWRGIPISRPVGA